VIRRAASHDHDLFNAAQLRVIQPDPVQHHPAGLHTGFQHGFDNPGLFVNFFKHKMRETLFLHRIDAELDRVDTMPDRFAAESPDINFIPAQNRHLAVFKVNDLFGQIQNRRHVRRDIIFILADADNQRRAYSRGDQKIRFLAADNPQRERPLKFPDSFLRRGNDIALIIFFDQMRNYFGIGFGNKSMTAFLQTRF